MILVIFFVLIEDNGYTRTLLKHLFCLIIEEEQETPKKKKKYFLGFWKSLIILASTIRSTKLIIEKTIVIQHSKDIKGH